MIIMKYCSRTSQSMTENRQHYRARPNNRHVQWMMYCYLIRCVIPFSKWLAYECGCATMNTTECFPASVNPPNNCLCVPPVRWIFVYSRIIACTCALCHHRRRCSIIYMRKHSGCKCSENACGRFNIVNYGSTITINNYFSRITRVPQKCLCTLLSMRSSRNLIHKIHLTLGDQTSSSTWMHYK